MSMKWLTVMFQVFIVLPLVTMAAIFTPTYHPTLWFLGVVFAGCAAVGTTISQVLSSKE